MILEAIKGAQALKWATSRAGLAVLLVLVSVLCVWGWTRETAIPADRPAQIPEVVARVPKGWVPLDSPECRVEVRSKPEIIKVVQLAPEIAGDPDKQVAEVTECAPSDGTTTVASVIDTRTGKTTLWTGQRPPAFFSTRALTPKWYAGAWYGYDLYGRQRLEAEAGRFLGRTGRLHWHAKLRAESDLRDEINGLALLGIVIQ